MHHPTPAGGTLAVDERGVSAVLGTILILVITVVGIAGVLYYGAPTIDRIQSRQAQTAMEGAFETLRDSGQELSVPDHARYPALNVPSGTLSLAAGDRFLIAADHDASTTQCGGSTCINCDFHVSDWNDAGGSVTISAPGCRTPAIACVDPIAAGTACLEIDAVTGNTATRQTVSLAGAVATVASADFSKGDWLFRLTDAKASPTVYAEAWLHTTDQVTWDLKSSTGRWQEFFDGGAVFSQSGGSYFLEKEAPIGDTTFGNSYYGFWLRTLVITGGYSSTSASGSHSISLALLGVSTRVDDAATYRLRFDISGPLAQPWCTSLVLRNPRLTGAAYTESTGFTCASGNALGLRSVCFARVASGACTSVGSSFKFRFLHARIATSLAS